MSFSKRAFEELNKYKLVINFDAKDEKDAENFIASLNVSDLIDHLEIDKGKSMKKIDIEQVDIVDAKNLANRLVEHAIIETPIAELLVKRLQSMVVSFATNLFLRDKDAYEQYLNLDGERSLQKYGRETYWNADDYKIDRGDSDEQSNQD
tara:strand:- start:435 stop:884 length:450 start_codon:yes stop_codon:yes gene_type:complete